MGATASSTYAITLQRGLESLASSTPYPFADALWLSALIPSAMEYSQALSTSPLDDATRKAVNGVLLTTARGIIANSGASSNFAQLLLHTADLLRKAQTLRAPAPSDTDAVQAIARAQAATTLTRLLLKNLLPNTEPDILASLLEAGPSSPPPLPPGVSVSNSQVSSSSTSTSSRSSPMANPLVAPVFLQALVNYLITADVVQPSFALHVEVLSTLITATGTQLYNPLDTTRHPLLTPLTDGSIKQIPALVRTLLLHFVQARTPPEPPQSLFSYLTSWATTIVSVPFSLFGPEDHVEFPLGERSLLLLLITALYHRPLPEGSNTRPSNPVLMALSSLHNQRGTDISSEEALTNPGSVPDLPFSPLYKTLCSTLIDHRITLLTYTLLHHNAAFRGYVLSRTDPETLTLPILDLLYDAQSRSSHQMYLLLIMLLILSSDPEWASNIHDIVIPRAPWYKDRALKDIPLGSLVILVLCRTIHYNLRELKDTYLHINVLATLGNLSSRFSNIHPFAASRMVSLFETMGRRYTKMRSKRLGAEGTIPDTTMDLDGLDTPMGSSTIAAVSQDIAQSSSPSPVSSPMSPLPEEPKSPVPQSIEEMEALEAPEESLYADFLRIFMETIQAALVHQLTHVPHLIYALLHKQEIFEPLVDSSRFGDLAMSIVDILTYFRARLEEAKDLDTSGAEGILDLINNAAPRYTFREAPPPPPEFKYSADEDAYPEDFFAPYIWSLVFDFAPLDWSPESLLLFDYDDDEDADDSDADDSDYDSGSDERGREVGAATHAPGASDKLEVPPKDTEAIPAVGEDGNDATSPIPVPRIPSQLSPMSTKDAVTLSSTTSRAVRTPAMPTPVDDTATPSLPPDGDLGESSPSDLL